MLDNIYSASKVLHTDHLPILQGLLNGTPVAPSHVQLIISDLCNQNCSFCSYRSDIGQSTELFKVIKEDNSVNINPARFIPSRKCKEILDDCAAMGVKAIQFTGGGEPTVHAEHVPIFRHALDHGLDCALVSNAIRWSPELIEDLVRFKWVRVSIDAGSADSYSRIRQVSTHQYYKMLEHVEALVKEKKKTSSDVVIGVGFVVTEDNYMEVVEATKQAITLGVDNLRISAMFSTENREYFTGFYRQAAVEAAKADVLAQHHGFNLFNMFGDRIDDLEQAHPNYELCGYQYYTTFIGGDQNVYRCCNTSYTMHGQLGSIKDRHFKDFWFDPITQAKLKNFKAPSCERCQFNERNKLIDYVLKDSPHLNFV